VARGLNKKDADGKTALFYAAMKNRPDVCVAILNHGGFLRQEGMDNDNNSALHLAARHDKADVCHALLIHDPDAANIMNRFGDTPLDIAHRFGHARVCAVFDHLHVLPN